MSTSVCKLFALNGHCGEVIWAVGAHFSGCCHYGQVAVVKRLKQEQMYGLSVGTQNITIVERSPL